MLLLRRVADNDDGLKRGDFTWDQPPLYPLRILARPPERTVLSPTTTSSCLTATVAPAETLAAPDFISCHRVLRLPREHREQGHALRQGRDDNGERHREHRLRSRRANEPVLHCRGGRRRAELCDSGEMLCTAGRGDECSKKFWWKEF